MKDSPGPLRTARLEAAGFEPNSKALQAGRGFVLFLRR